MFPASTLSPWILAYGIGSCCELHFSSKISIHVVWAIALSTLLLHTILSVNIRKHNLPVSDNLIKAYPYSKVIHSRPQRPYDASRAESTSSEAPHSWFVDYFSGPETEEHARASKRQDQADSKGPPSNIFDIISGPYTGDQGLVQFPFMQSGPVSDIVGYWSKNGGSKGLSNNQCVVLLILEAGSVLSLQR
jgi:hypothetical protein